jgi:carboxyvinyl-carboxyphosphonate phosphorylmutase
MANKKLEVFKTKLHAPQMLIAPGAYDCLCAKVIEKLGFDAVYITGSGLSFSTMGKPDVGLMTLTEVAYQVEYIVDSTNLPVIADIDTGFGNAINVIHTVKKFKKIGVTAVQLEDQIIPKKCGHYLGKELVSSEEMVGKIKAAKDYAGDDVLLIARTDARTPFCIEEAIRRAKIYEEAGADIIFVESPESVEEMRLVNKCIKAPTFVNVGEGTRTPLLTVQELEEIGYKIAIYPNSIARMALKSSMEVLEELKKKGTTKRLLEKGKMADWSELHEFFDLSNFIEMEKKYVPICQNQNKN